MPTQAIPKNDTFFDTQEIKLAALLLAETPDSTAEVCENGNSIKKVIRVFFPQDSLPDVNGMISSFINRQARVDVFKYNKSLNFLRDMINGR